MQRNSPSIELKTCIVYEEDLRQFAVESDDKTLKNTHISAKASSEILGMSVSAFNDYVAKGVIISCNNHNSKEDRKFDLFEIIQIKKRGLSELKRAKRYQLRGR
jgi:hypothetical protein